MDAVCVSSDIVCLALGQPSPIRQATAPLYICCREANASQLGRYLSKYEEYKWRACHGTAGGCICYNDDRFTLRVKKDDMHTTRVRTYINTGGIVIYLVSGDNKGRSEEANELVSTREHVSDYLDFEAYSTSLTHDKQFGQATYCVLQYFDTCWRITVD